MADVIPWLYFWGFLWFWLSSHFFDVKLWRRDPTRSQSIEIFASMFWPITVPARYLNLRLRKIKDTKEGRSNG
jgi:hypothetical protein